MKKNILSLVGLFFLIAAMPAEAQRFQEGVSGPTNFSASNLDLWANGRNPNLDLFFEQVRMNADKRLNPSDIIGSAYPIETFLPGKINANGDHLGDFYMRYDAFSDEVQLKKTSVSTEEYKALFRSKDIEAVIGDKVYEYHKFYDAKNRYYEGYLVPLVSAGNHTLYLRQEATFKYGKLAQSSLVREVPNRFEQEEAFYMAVNNGTRIVEIPSKKKKFLKLVDANLRDDLNNYLKENDIDLRDEQDLRKLFRNFFKTIQ